jgi:hypothetical protein
VFLPLRAAPEGSAAVGNNHSTPNDKNSEAHIDQLPDCSSFNRKFDAMIRSVRSLPHGNAADRRRNEDAESAEKLLSLADAQGVFPTRMPLVDGRTKERVGLLQATVKLSRAFGASIRAGLPGGYFYTVLFELPTGMAPIV